MSRVIAGQLALAGVAAAGWVEHGEGIVVCAAHGAPPRAPDEHAPGLLSAGLVDLQVHGAAGQAVTGCD